MRQDNPASYPPYIPIFDKDQKYLIGNGMDGELPNKLFRNVFRWHITMICFHPVHIQFKTL